MVFITAWSAATRAACARRSGKRVRQVAWCSGGAQAFFHEATGLDIDCFLTGEAPEFVTHLAAETGIGFLAAGHHATERYGWQRTQMYAYRICFPSPSNMSSP